jgi:hypothetical protein
MALTPFKKGDRIRDKKTGQLGTVTEVNTNDPAQGPDVSVFYMVRVIVRLDGEQDMRAFEGQELEQVG